MAAENIEEMNQHLEAMSQMIKLSDDKKKEEEELTQQQKVEIAEARVRLLRAKQNYQQKKDLVANAQLKLERMEKEEADNWAINCALQEKIAHMEKQLADRAMKKMEILNRYGDKISSVVGEIQDINKNLDKERCIADMPRLMQENTILREECRELDSQYKTFAKKLELSKKTLRHEKAQRASLPSEEEKRFLIGAIRDERRALVYKSNQIKVELKNLMMEKQVALESSQDESIQLEKSD